MKNCQSQSLVLPEEEGEGTRSRNIVDAVRFAASRIKNLQLIVLGRNAKDAEVELKQLLSGVSVELRVLGVLPAEDVTRTLSVSDVLLFVRGHISNATRKRHRGNCLGLASGRV
jgi:hypothetical protein